MGNAQLGPLGGLSGEFFAVTFQEVDILLGKRRDRPRKQEKVRGGGFATPYLDSTGYCSANGVGDYSYRSHLSSTPAPGTGVLVGPGVGVGSSDTYSNAPISGVASRSFPS